MKKTPTPPAEKAGQGPNHDLMQVIATDEHKGCGGCYVFDPTTGKRTPATPTPEQET